MVTLCTLSDELLEGKVTSKSMDFSLMSIVDLCLCGSLCGSVSSDLVAAFVAVLM
jgi:hypothetical protein